MRPAAKGCVGSESAPGAEAHRLRYEDPARDVNSRAPEPRLWLDRRSGHSLESECYRLNSPLRASQERRLEENPIYETDEDFRPERAVLVGLAAGRPLAQVVASLDELDRLADTAGAEVKDRMIQRRARARASTFLSSGKLDELHSVCKIHDADLAIFDDDLTPAQVRNLEKALQVKVIDRSELILSIFARRARTREARLQVELAQLEYTLPRLRHMWQHLSRTGGGIGIRGPGETQLEVDRRRARERISKLKAALKDVEQERETQRKLRRRLYRLAIVGYTNAGKSTLFNTLTRASVLTEDRLFATLDATTRKMAGPTADGRGRHNLLLTDTVGFIRKLPHHLVASFRSTLSEVVEADLLLLLLDASDPEVEVQRAEVERVLDELGVKGKPRLIVFNKIDRLGDSIEGYGFRIRHPDCVLVSAQTGEGIDVLRQRLQQEAAAADGTAAA
jgi:GTP-binding protein HflX